MEADMNQDEVPSSGGLHRVLRTSMTIAALLLLPPFIALAVLPMLLLLAPVALIGVPFIIPALLTGSLAARSEDKVRASWRPPVPQPMLRQRSKLRAVS
jgi:hypothetical protein